MGDLEQVPGDSGATSGPDPETVDEAREAALMRQILRTQEQHREGGIEPALDETSEDPPPGA